MKHSGKNTWPIFSCMLKHWGGGVDEQVMDAGQEGSEEEQERRDVEGWCSHPVRRSHFPLKWHSNSEGKMLYIHKLGNQCHCRGCFGRADERKVSNREIFLEVYWRNENLNTLFSNSCFFRRATNKSLTSNDTQLRSRLQEKRNAVLQRNKAVARRLPHTHAAAALMIRHKLS